MRPYASGPSMSGHAPKAMKPFTTSGLPMRRWDSLSGRDAAYRQALRLATKDLYIKALAGLDKQILERNKVGRKPAGD